VKLRTYKRTQEDLVRPSLVGNLVGLVGHLEGLKEGLVDGEVHSVYAEPVALAATYSLKMAPRC
jgi:hypothetical protein